ncbi:hypothetical protein Hanom_Chr14g01298081 [Helianthus anomalus]
MTRSSGRFRPTRDNCWQTILHWLFMSFMQSSACFLLSTSANKLSRMSRNSASTSFESIWDPLSDDNSDAGNAIQTINYMIF